MDPNTPPVDPEEVANDIAVALAEVYVVDENGNETNIPKYTNLAVLDGDTVGVENYDGHRFFVEVQVHD